MITDNIKGISIDESGRLCIFPERERFTMIYREAAEVNWDNDKLFLYSPQPREWSYFDWYKHIFNVVKDCNCNLLLTKDTLWINIPSTLKKQIEDFYTFDH